MNAAQSIAILCIASLSATPALMAQPENPNDIVWLRQIGKEGDDKGNGVAVDKNGNVYVTGSTVGSLGGPGMFGGDGFLLKYDAEGNLLWSRQPGTQHHDEGVSVAVDAMGNSFIAQNVGNGRALMLKYDTEGNLLWTREIELRGLEYGYSVAVDATGNAYICGQTSEGVPGTGLADAFLVKYDTTGNMLWNRLVATNRADLATGVAVDASGNAFIVGLTHGDIAGVPNAGKGDVFLAKIDATGNLLWTRQIGSPRLDSGIAVAVDEHGNAYIAGFTFGNLGGPNAGDRDAYLARYDPSGNLLWIRQFGGPLDDSSLAIAVDTQGNAILTGSTRNRLGGFTKPGGGMFLAKYDTSGTMLKIRQFDSLGLGLRLGLAMDDQGNAHITGMIAANPGGPPLGSFDVYVMKIEQGCYADCDNSATPRVLDVGDFLCFQRMFVQRDPYACNCEVSTGFGVCDIFDFLCFQNAFVTGCP